MAAKLHEASGDGTMSRNIDKPPLKGFVYVGIGILFLLSPILSTISFFVSTAQDDENPPGVKDGTLNHLYEYWNETRPFLRVLTVMPATIVICVCHWVSIRIYLRR